MARRAFVPPPAWLTLLTVLLCVLFVFLGRWQWNKGNLREREWEAYARGTQQVQALGSRGMADVPLFQRVSVTGRLDSAHQFLIDNQGYAGRPGYDVVTPLQRPDGRIVIVNRGWVPFTGRRDRLPVIALTHLDPVTLTGRTGNLPTPGLALGRAAPPPGPTWPKVTSFPSLDQLATRLGRPVEPRVLLLDAHQPDSYVCDWQPPGMPPLRHWSYAIQWWAFAVLAVVLWGVLSVKRGARTP